MLLLRTMEMTYGMTIHVIHISGKKMIAQGTDGCLRGSLMEGVMAGVDMLTFVDLSRGALSVILLCSIGCVRGRDDPSSSL